MAYADPREGKFNQHRCNARSRGIEFLFTFEEWLKVWEDALGPDWMSKRGVGKGKHVMARFKDEGPYAPGNVEIITHPENVRTRKMSEKFISTVSAMATARNKARTSEEQSQFGKMGAEKRWRAK